MNDERQGERQIERDSQLSAMFDGELTGAECELIARRLARDEALRSQWSRYSMIGAAIRAERGVALHDRVAWRVQSVVAQEAAYGDGADIGATNARTAAVVPNESTRAARARAWNRFVRPLAGAGIAASVAAAAIVFLRVQGTSGELLVEAAPATQPAVVASSTAPVSIAAVPSARVAVVTPGDAGLYSTPAPNPQTNIAPPASLANYVVAHSEFSGPISRRMALLGVLASENGTVAVPAQSADGESRAAEAANAQ